MVYYADLSDLSFKRSPLQQHSSVPLGNCS